MAAPSSIAEPARKHKSLARNDKTWMRYSVEMPGRRQEILRSDAPPGLFYFTGDASLKWGVSFRVSHPPRRLTPHPLSIFLAGASAI
jgi:hypothetical protein